MENRIRAEPKAFFGASPTLHATLFWVNESLYFFLILCVFIPFSDGLMERSERSASAVAKAEQSHSSPYEFYGKPFYGKTTTDVIVQEGNHAFFHCLVHNLGNQTVSVSKSIQIFILQSHCLKITQNVAFDIFNFGIFHHFLSVKTDLSGNTVWPQASAFKKLDKMDHFWHFN